MRLKFLIGFSILYYLFSSFSYSQTRLNNEFPV